MGGENGIRPAVEGYRIFGVRYVSASKQSIDEYDLCPECAMKVWEYISKYDEHTEDLEANSKREKPTKLCEDVDNNICEKCVYSPKDKAKFLFPGETYYYKICDECYKGSQFIPKKEESDG